MDTYGYVKSRELFQRAVKVIPAGVYGHLDRQKGALFL